MEIEKLHREAADGSFLYPGLHVYAQRFDSCKLGGNKQTQL